jgi:8-oxo-dGTP pyrophosphatase MutT (NUDIX family)
MSKLNDINKQVWKNMKTNSAAGLLFYKIVNNSIELLTLYGTERPYKQEKHQLWDIPGGKKEIIDNGDPVLCACREFCEETNFILENVYNYNYDKFVNNIQNNVTSLWIDNSNYVLCLVNIGSVDNILSSILQTFPETFKDYKLTNNTIFEDLCWVNVENLKTLMKFKKVRYMMTYFLRFIYNKNELFPYNCCGVHLST